MKKNTKSALMIVALAVSFALFAYLVFAWDLHNSIRTIAPASNSNHSSNFVLNVSYQNATAAITNPRYQNTSCYINTSGAWVVIANISGYNITSNATFFTVDLTSITDGKGGAVNCTIGNQTTLVHINVTNMSIRVTIDDTQPTVSVPAIKGTNFSKLNSTTAGGLVTLNATINDTTIGLHAAVNRSIKSVFFNLSNWSEAQETIFYAGEEGNSGHWSNTTGLNMSLYQEGKYTIRVHANDTLGNSNSTEIWKSYFDTTIPVVHAANITSPTVGRNYSQELDANIAINLSLQDPVNGSNASGIDTVLFILKNGTGTTNATLSATREASTNRWSALVNTTHYLDSNYTVTVEVNDSAGNSNDSAFTVGFFYVDNTDPVLTYRCSPSTTVTQDESLSCTCSGADATSGFNTTSLSYTSNPSTGNTGTYSIACTGKDNAGNSVRREITYTVTAPGSSSGGGGGGTGITWTTRSVTKQEFTQGHTIQLPKNNRARVSVDNSDHYVGVLSLSSTTAKIQVSSTPQEATLSIGDTRRFEVTGDNFYDIQVTLNTIVSSKADVTLKSIHEEITPETTEEEAEKQEEAEKEAAGEELKTSWLFWLAIIIVVILIAVVISYVIYKKNK